MLKEHWRTISRVERFGDFLIVILSFFSAYYGRSSLLFWNESFDWGLPFTGEQLAPISEYYVVLLLGLLFYGAFLQLLGAYSSMRLRSSWQLFRLAVVSSTVVFLLLGSFLFLLKLDLSRSFIALFCALVALSLALERYLVLEFLRFWRKRGKNFRNLIIAGVGEQAVDLTASILRRPELGIRIRGYADLREGADRSELLDSFRKRLQAVGKKRIGRILLGPDSLQQALKDYAIDEVIFTDVIDVMPQVEECVLACSEQGVRTTIAANLFSIGMIRSEMSYFGGMPLIHFETPPGDRWELSCKRLLDLSASFALLVLLAPVLLIIAGLIKLTSNGPVLFVQRRVGQNGRLFDLYKFRSMVENAEAQLKELKDQNEMSGPVFKMKHDPRVTTLGSFLRKYSLDELPQLWNVLIGDMSLVGPRPPVPGEVSLYERRDRRRLSMRPGITCTWQVSGRNDITDFEDWVRMDLEYIDNWSLGRDFVLLLKTIPAVLFGTGAR